MPATRQAPIHRHPARELATATIAIETPVAIVLNGISHAVMLATPHELEAFALGFALSEGLLQSPDECRHIDIVEQPQGIELQLEVPAAVEMRLKQRRRDRLGATGCGLCGIDSLQRLDATPERITPSPWMQTFDARTVLQAFTQLPAQQPLNRETGALHAAAWATLQGELVKTMEDIGRHNALDKLLGWRAMNPQEAGDGFVVMTSRASFELVRKCARLNVPALAVISAPTSLAIDTARAAGLQLYGFCRGDEAVRYA
jgi:FdhD protein